MTNTFILLPWLLFSIGKPIHLLDTADVDEIEKLASAE